MSASAHAVRRDWRLPDAPLAEHPVEAVDRRTMVEADRIATERLGLSFLQLMEIAGRELADLTRLVLGGSVLDRTVVVLAGTGNNAGGGLVAARRLAGWGAKVSVVLARPIRRLRPGPCAQIEPLLAAGVQTAVAGYDHSYPEIADDIGRADAVLDALIGYTLRGAPDGEYRPLIEMAALSQGPVIGLDLPSGIDSSTGERPGAAVEADITLGLALPKRGTVLGEGLRLAGVQYLADIGIPRSVFTELGVTGTPTFTEGSLLRLT